MVYNVTVHTSLINSLMLFKVCRKHLAQLRLKVDSVWKRINGRKEDRYKSNKKQVMNS